MSLTIIHTMLLNLNIISQSETSEHAELGIFHEKASRVHYKTEFTDHQKLTS